MAQGQLARFLPDSTTFAAYGALLLGVIAGVGFGTAGTMHFAPDMFGLGTCQETRLDSDGVRALILKDEAERAADRA